MQSVDLIILLCIFITGVIPVVVMVNSDSNFNVSIGVNIKAVNSSMIQGIYHIKNQSMFQINLRENSDCEEPFFFLRLSGAALLAPFQTKIKDRIFAFPYQISITGQYFLEILFFGCDFKTDYADQFMNRCLEIPPDMTINQPYSTILEKKYSLPGWVNVGVGKSHTGVKTSFRKTVDYGNHADRNWVKNYHYQGLTSTTEYFYNLQSLLGKLHVEDTFKVCFIGRSHSLKYKLISETIHPLLVKKDKIFSRLQFQYVDMRLFSCWDNSSFTEPISSCSVGVVGMGQWAAAVVKLGYKKPYGAKEFRAAMVELVHKFQDYPGTKFYLRSIHHNGLRWMKLTCPPTDWRVPYLIDEYNRELKNLSIENKIPYIDTDPIVRPMWDACYDFSHLEGNELEEDFKFILWSIAQDFREVEKF